MKRKKNKILVYFRNIYAIIGLIFFIWMVFLDTNSLVKFIGLKKKLDRLENEKTKLEIEILKDKEWIKKLNDSIEIEKYGIVKSFYEKVKNPPTNLANGAVYAFDNDFLEWISENNNEFKDFSIEVIPLLVGKIFTWHTSKIFIDIGTPSSLKSARDLYSSLNKGNLI